MEGNESDHSGHSKEAGTTYFLEVERESKGSDSGGNSKEGKTTYFLEVEREGKTSNRSSNSKGGRDDVLSGGGERGQEVRSQ